MLPRKHDADEHMETSSTNQGRKNQIKINHDAIALKKQIEEANINTWTHPNGQIQRQID